MPLNGELGLLFTEEVYKEEDDICDGLIFPNVLRLLELVDIGNYLT